MFRFERTKLAKRKDEYKVFRGETPVSYSEAAALWKDDESFRQRFTEALCNSEFSAFRWETPPVNQSFLDRDFEFVLLNCPGLARTPDRKSFADFFLHDEAVVHFENLGKDALLVVPSPATHDSQFSHLKGFLKTANEATIHEFWAKVGTQFLQRVSEQGEAPVWLSTAGMGVAWLHVRMDSYPKYYGHQEYRAWSLS